MAQASAKRIAEFRATTDKVVNMLAQRRVKVTQQGMDACVRYRRDGTIDSVNIPHIPDTATDQALDAIRGYIDHEVGHVLFTEVAFHPGLIHPKHKQLASLKAIAGFVEDVFVEKEMQKQFPGSANNLDGTLRFVIEQFTKPELKKGKHTPISLLIMPIIRSMGGQRAATELLAEIDAESIVGAEMKLLAPFAERIMRVKSTKEGTQIGLEIVEALKAAAAPPPPPPPPEPEPEPETVAEPEKGESKKTEDDDSEGTSDAEPEEGESDETDESKKEKGDKDEADDAEGSEDDAESGESDEKEAGAGDSEDETDGTDEADDEGEEKPGEDGKSGDSDEEADDGEEETDATGGSDDEADDSEEESDGEGDAGGDADEEGEGEDDGESEGTGGSEGEKSDADGDPEGEGSGGDETSEDSIESADGDDDAASEEVRKLAAEMLAKLAETPEGSEALAEAIAMALRKGIDDNTYLPFTTDFDETRVVEVVDSAKSDVDAAIVLMDERMRGMVGQLQANMRRLFAQQAQAVNYGGQRRGRLQANALHRLATGDDRVFFKREEHEATDTAITLLLDLSGSMMSGQKIETACLAGYALSQILERLNITHEVLGFSTGDMITVGNPALEAAMKEQQTKMGRPFSRFERLIQYVFKSFDERMTHVVKQRLVGTSRLPIARGSVNVKTRNNVDGESVMMAATRLLTRREPRKIMMVLSDGEPAAHAYNLEEHLRDTVKAIEKMGIETIGIGIDDTAVRRFYPKHVVINNVEELPAVVMNQLKRLLIERKNTIV